MQIDFFGANCLRFKTPSVSLVFDDNLSDLGGKSPTTTSDVVCITNSQLVKPPKNFKIIFDTPGNYEVSDVLIDGIRAQAFLDEEGQMNATIYKIYLDNFVLVMVGHIKPQLSDQQIEQLGMVDALLIPVGGGDYTLDGQKAAQLTKHISPRLVIPTYYKQSGLKFDQTLDDYQEFIKSLAIEPEFIDGSSLKLKKNDLSEQLSLKIFKT